MSTWDLKTVTVVTPEINADLQASPFHYRADNVNPEIYQPVDDALRMCVEAVITDVVPSDTRSEGLATLCQQPDSVNKIHSGPAPHLQPVHVPDYLNAASVTPDIEAFIVVTFTGQYPDVNDKFATAFRLIINTVRIVNYRSGLLMNLIAVAQKLG